MKPIEISDFENYRSISSLNYSPSGDVAAFIVTKPSKAANGYKKELWISRGDSAEKLIPENVVNSYIWDDGDTLLFSADMKNPYHKMAGDCTVFYRQSIDSSEKVYAFTIPLMVSQIKKLSDGIYLIAARTDVNHPDYYKMSEDERAAIEEEKKNGPDFEIIDEIPFWMNGAGVTDKKRTTLYIYKEDDSSLTPLSPPTCNAFSFNFNDKYVLFCGESYEKKQLRCPDVYTYNIETGEIRTILTRTKYSMMGIEVVDNKFIFSGSTHERYGQQENNCFYMIDPETGDVTLIADPDMYITNCVGCDCHYGDRHSFRSYGGYLYFITTQVYTAELWRMDLSGNFEKIITKEGSVEDFDISGDTVLLAGLYDMKPHELYKCTLSDPEPVQISDFNTEALKDCYVAVPETVEFENNGFNMRGWVLKPYDYDESKTYPGVLSVHGGPRTAFAPVFFHEMQALAGKGFFVFYCNPEGSAGSNEFADVRGKYGTKDYDDLMLFTDTVLEKYPQIDQTRLGVIGGSYGGFMTNWIIGHTDRFAAAASQRSISNWVTFYCCTDIGPYFGADQTAGTPYTEKGLQKMWDQSPLKYVTNAKTPTLFIHSNEDYRCYLPEALQMYTGLLENGVDTKICMFKGENHELSRSGKPKNRIKRLEEIFGWLEKYTAE